MLTLVFVLGFLGIGLVQNISSADDTNPTRNTTVDCSFYIFIHDDSGNPMSGVKVNAYSDANKTNLIGTSEASNSKGWAKLTSYQSFTGSTIYLKPDESTLPEGHKVSAVGNQSILSAKANTTLLDAIMDAGQYFAWDVLTTDDIYITSDTSWYLKATTNSQEVFPGENLDPDSIVAYKQLFGSGSYIGFTVPAFEIKPGEPEQPDPEQPEPTIETGNLQITKTTSDNNTSTSFNVKVTLSGTSTDSTSANTVSGIYGDATFDDGIATISIKHNQTKNITGLPAGIDYSIEEINPGDYAATYTNQTGTITKDQTTTVAINNNKDREYKLYFRKVDADTGEELHGWEFTFGNATITEDNNLITFYKYGNTYGAKDKNGNTISNLISSSGYISSKRLTETLAPYGYAPISPRNYSAYPLTNPGSTDRIDNKNWKYFQKIDDWSGEMVVENEKTYVTIDKNWSSIFNNNNGSGYHGYTGGSRCGKWITNTTTGKTEWKEIIPDFPQDMETIESVFEIEFENLRNGEFPMSGMKESILRVDEYKARFSLIGQRTKVESGPYRDGRVYFRVEDARITGLPVGVSFKIKEVSVNYRHNEYVDWGLVEGLENDFSGRRHFYFFNNLTCETEKNTPEDLKSTYKMKFQKKAINVDEDREYEFTILPLFGYASGYVDIINIPFDGTYHGINSVHDFKTLYSVWLHGEDGDKVVDRQWFMEYISSFWDIWFTTDSEYSDLDDYNEWVRLMAESMLFRVDFEGAAVTTGGLIDGPDDGDWYLKQPIYADPESVEKMVEIINMNTNNFFEYEGGRVIEKSRALREKINSLGYENTQEWMTGVSERIREEDSIEGQVAIMDEFLGCFTDVGWTVDDFRYFRLMTISESNIPEGGINYGHSVTWKGDGVTIYDVYNDINDEIYNNDEYGNGGWEHFADTGFDPETNKYFFGRTFKLKNGESIELNFPLQIAYDYGFLILEKKTGDDMEYTQDNSIIASMQYLQKDSDGNYRANVVYKNTYPAPEPEPEEEPEPEVPPKEIPVETVNPRTGDMKILPMIIMAGSALVLALGLLGLRRTKRI